ncbi:MAG: galactose mutarotase [Bacteroidales bacterium]|nr:galactose mutarotase [Bacteroidales bacterium]
MITKTLWDTAEGGKEIFKYRITNKKGFYVELSSLGAGIVSIVVPDKDGKAADVVLGYDKALDYMADGPCGGKCPGRYANRIAKGRFTLDGKQYELPVNNGPNHLHGGPQGFQNQVWDSRIDGDDVEFMYYSADGEAGYPGNLKVTARYSWSDDNVLTLTFAAVTDAPTVVNLTNHAYFNLAGQGDVLSHELTLNASEYLPTDDTLIPLGDSEPVAGTPMDFINPKPLGRDLKADFPALNYGKGYDNCFVIDGYEPGQIQRAAELFDPLSGRVLEVLTTQPGVQIYTGNWLTGCPAGKGRTWNDYDAVAIECQHFPDSPNHPDYPSTVLRPGETFNEAIILAFSVR